MLSMTWIVYVRFVLKLSNVDLVSLLVFLKVTDHFSCYMLIFGEHINMLLSLDANFPSLLWMISPDTLGLFHQI